MGVPWRSRALAPCLLLVAATLVGTASALYEDQVGINNWHKKYVGQVKTAVVGAKRVYVATEQNVFAGISAKTGTVGARPPRFGPLPSPEQSPRSQYSPPCAPLRPRAADWRHVLEEADSLDDVAAVSASSVATVSKQGKFLRCWGAQARARAPAPAAFAPHTLPRRIALTRPRPWRPSDTTHTGGRPALGGEDLPRRGRRGRRARSAPRHRGQGRRRPRPQHAAGAPRARAPQLLGFPAFEPLRRRRPATIPERKPPSRRSAAPPRLRRRVHVGG